MVSCGGPGAAIEPPPVVSYFDDFLGIDFSPHYNISTVYGGEVSLGSPGLTASLIGTGGVARLVVQPTEEQGVARLRFGEDGYSGPVDIRNWLPARNLHFGALVQLSTIEDVDLTVGFIGLGDPLRVLAALYKSHTDTWIFQVINRANGITERIDVVTSVAPSPGVTHLIEIEATGNYACLKIDGVMVAEVTDPKYIPSTPLAVEFQLWNNQVGGVWNSPSVLIDWWGAEQNR